MSRASLSFGADRASAPLSCAYYRDRLTGALWAMRIDNGRIVSAVGPLPPSAMAAPPMQHLPGPVPADVSGWSLLAFQCVGEVWQLHRKNRIAPGLSRPGGKATISESATGFSIRLIQ